MTFATTNSSVFAISSFLVGLIDVGLFNIMFRCFGTFFTLVFQFILIFLLQIMIHQLSFISCSLAGTSVLNYSFLCWPIHQTYDLIDDIKLVSSINASSGFGLRSRTTRKPDTFSVMWSSFSVTTVLFVESTLCTLKAPS